MHADRARSGQGPAAFQLAQGETRRRCIHAGRNAKSGSDVMSNERVPPRMSLSYEIESAGSASPFHATPATYTRSAEYAAMLQAALDSADAPPLCASGLDVPREAHAAAHGRGRVPLVDA